MKMPHIWLDSLGSEAVKSEGVKSEGVMSEGVRSERVQEEACPRPPESHCWTDQTPRSW